MERHETGHGGRPSRSPWSRIITGSLTALALALTSVLLVPTAAAAPKVAAMADQQVTFDAEMITLINKARVNKGLWPLVEAKGLTQMSVWWADQMRTTGEFKHYPTAFQDVKKYGASNRLIWGENVGRFTPNVTPQALFNAYMNSPGHRANIMSDRYFFIGMGTVSNGSLSYNAMEFTDQIDTTTVISVKGAWKSVSKKTVKKNAKTIAKVKAAKTLKAKAKKAKRLRR